ncbi:unnamed protein product, partial [Effrenium voratum]
RPSSPAPIPGTATAPTVQLRTTSPARGFSPDPGAQSPESNKSSTPRSQPRLPSLLFRATASNTSGKSRVDDGPTPTRLDMRRQLSDMSPMPSQIRKQLSDGSPQVRRVVSNASVSVSGKMRKAQSDGSEVNVQQQRSGASATSETSQVSQGSPKVPLERHQWELATTDPSSWPSLGISSTGLMGIGRVGGDGLLSDNDNTLHFALDRRTLSSILEGDSSFNAAQFKNGQVAQASVDALQQTKEQNAQLRAVCWELIALAGDWDAELEDMGHQELMREAVRSLEILRERLGLGQETPKEVAIPTIEEADDGADCMGPLEEEGEMSFREEPEAEMTMNSPERTKISIKAPEMEAAACAEPEGSPEIRKLQRELKASGSYPVLSFEPGENATKPRAPVVHFTPPMRERRSLVGVPSTTSGVPPAACRGPNASPAPTMARSATCPVRSPQATRAWSMNAPSPRPTGPSRSPERGYMMVEPVVRNITPLRQPATLLPPWQWQQDPKLLAEQQRQLLHCC